MKHFRSNILICCTVIFSICFLVYTDHLPQITYDDWQEIGPGTRYRTASSTNPNWQIRIIEVDTTHSNIRLEPVWADSLQTTSQLAENAHGIAAINAGYFSGGNSVSYYREDGDRKASNVRVEARSVFGLTGNHQEQLMQTRIANDNIPHDPEWDSVLDAIGGGPQLIRDGEIDILIEEEGIDATSGIAPYSRQPRTFLGWHSDTKKVYLVTVDGRQQNWSVGMTMEEGAQLLKDIGCNQGLNYDGGGSTTAWVNGTVVNSPSDGFERQVKTAWVVVPSVIIDNTDSEFSSTGSWGTSANPGYYNTNSLFHLGGNGSSTATWTPQLEKSGEYDVYAWWVAAGNRADEAPYYINHADGDTTVVADQTGNGSQWNYLGTFNFNEGSGGFVRLSNAVPSNQYVSADAVKFVRTGDYTEPLDLQWSKDINTFSWFNNDNNTRGFALNPLTGNVLAASYGSGGIFILCHQDGSQIGELAGSSGLASHLGLTTVAATRSGKIFASNLATETGEDNSHLYYWESETASSYTTLTADAPARTGDFIDAYEDPQGNITVLMSGNQGTSQPKLLQWTYDGTEWTNSVVSLQSGGEGNLRMVTIKHERQSDYEIWMKDLTGPHYRFSSNGDYLGTTLWEPGTTLNSNYYFGPDEGGKHYIAAGNYQQGSALINLYDARSGSILASASFENSNANTNGTGRMSIASYNEQMYILGGITNNAIQLFSSQQTTAVENWHLY